MLLIVFWYCVALSSALPLHGQSIRVPRSNVLVNGEELVYNVRYSFIDLGQIKINTLDNVQTPTYLAYNTKAQIQSYPGIPFVDLHAIYESVIDTGMFSRHFVGKSREDNVWDFSIYDFEYENNRVLIEMGDRDTVVKENDTLSINTLYQDGLSLFFYARDQLFSHENMNIPTLVKEQKANTFIDSKKKRSTVETDFVDYPVDVIRFEGRAEFVGIFGMTGDFEGWFSNDEARIPILAKLKVIIGSVTLELMQWNRSGWKPPRGHE